jgi:hypothetical protein
MPEPITLRLVRAPGGFPVAFTTWAPEGWAVEAELEPPAVRFVAAFGGTPDPRAFLEVGLAPEGATLEQALERARGALGADAVPIPAAERRRAWSLQELRSAPPSPSEPRFGHLAVGRHGERYFHVLTTFPAAYADGFGPRAQPILDAWRWGDGSPLGS